MNICQVGDGKNDSTRLIQILLMEVLTILKKVLNKALNQILILSVVMFGVMTAAQAMLIGVMIIIA
jgi:hypothetical protein